MESYKVLLPLVTVLLIVGLWLVVLRWPRGIYYTFSQHVAQHKIGVLYYCGLFVVTLPLLVLFIGKYFVPTHDITPVVTWLVVLSALAQIACTLVPETGGKRTTIHRLLAGISGAALLPVLIFSLITGTGFAAVGLVIGWLAFGTMLAVLATIVLLRSKKLPNLLLQTTYFAAFFIALFTLVYA
ncbi:MAG: hypothetical protein WBP26_06130 [Candidatus Saccharimonadales bacterium]